MTRLRTGHCKLTHKYLFKKTEPQMYNYGNEIILINHLLFKCKRYHAHGQKYKITSSVTLISQIHVIIYPKLAKEN